MPPVAFQARPAQVDQPVLNHIELSMASMGTRPHHVVGNARGRAREQGSDLLEVWLGLLEQIEGPRRKRAEEFRRRRDNPKRRNSNRSSRLRTFSLR
jgi:hypothetical protein